MSEAVPQTYRKICLPDSGGRDWLTYHRAPAGTVEIDDINVLTQRRQGRGRRLIEMLLKEVPDACTIFLFTRESNVVAQKFYEAMGFVRTATVRTFYEPPSYITPNANQGDRGCVFYVLNRR
jgi:hypothetical protein